MNPDQTARGHGCFLPRGPISSLRGRSLLLLGSLLGLSGVLSAAEPSPEAPEIVTQSGQLFREDSPPARPAYLIQPADLPNVWADPAFVEAFLGSYGFNTAVEPKPTLEEGLFLREELQPLLSRTVEAKKRNEDAIEKTDDQFKRDRAEAIELLRKRLKGEIEDQPKRRKKDRVPAQASALLNFILGNLYLENDDVTNAIVQYDAAVVKLPTFLRAPKNLGLVLVQQNQFGRAIEHLSKTIQLGGGDSLTYGWLGNCHSMEENYLSAELAYKNALLIEANPDSRKRWKLGLVKALIELKNLRQAEALLDELIDVHPEDATLWSLQAGIYLQDDQPLKAALNFEMMRKLGQASVDNLMLLGDIYQLRLESIDLALPVYLEAVEKQPGQNVGRVLKAVDLLIRQGAWKEAVTMFAKIKDVSAAGMNEGERQTFAKLESKVLWNDGEQTKAIAALESLVKADPIDGDVQLLLADYYSKSGQTEKAIYRLELTSRISGFEADAFVKHAQLLVQEQKYTEAVDLLRRAQKLNPREHVQRFLDKVELAARTKKA